MKKWLLAIILIASSMVLAGNIYSQQSVSFGVYISPDLGYRLPLFQSNHDKNKLILVANVYRPAIGYSTGVNVRIPIKSAWFVEGGLRFAHRMESRTLKEQLFYLVGPDPNGPEFMKNKFSHNYFEIPVNVGFKLKPSSFFSIWLNMGFCSGFRILSMNAYIYYYPNDLKQKEITFTEGPYRNFSLMAQTGISMEIKLKKNLNLRINPELRQSLISINNSSSGETSRFLSSFGINTGIIFRK